MTCDNVQKLFYAFLATLAAIILAFAYLIGAALWQQAQGEPHMHGATPIPGSTGRFYATWVRPRFPDQRISCCDHHDCYASPARFENGRLQMRHRESGDWIDIDPKDIEQNRDSPDGQSHLCATPAKYVYCAIVGGGS